MTSRLTQYAFVSLLLIAGYGLSTFSVAQDMPVPPPKNEFEGKVVRVFLSDQPLREIALKDVELVEIGSRLMLVGTGVNPVYADVSTNCKLQGI